MLCKSKSFDTKLCIAGVLAVQDQLRKSIVVFLKLTSDLRAMMLHGHMHWAMSGRPLNVAPQDCMHALHLSECNCDESLSLTLKLQDFKSMFGMVPIHVQICFYTFGLGSFVTGVWLRDFVFPEFKAWQSYFEIRTTRRQEEIQ